MAGQAPIGIIGGTFDPVHYGHLRLAEEARAALGLASVLWIPAGQPPHRDAPGAGAGHRLAMTRLALAGNAGFELDDGEVSAAQPSYTVTTLERLRARHGAQCPLVLLLGADAFLGLASWHRWRDLFDLAHIAVAGRPGFALAAHAMAPALAAQFGARRSDDTGALRRAPAGAIVQFEITPLAISATQLRVLLGAGRSARYLLPDPVLDYIGRNHLYSPAPHGP